MFKKHSKAKSVGPRTHRYYWFTIQSPNGQTLATSETYTTAAMRDKGIEAVKKVVYEEEIKRIIAKHTKDGYKKEKKEGNKKDGLQFLNEQYGVPPALLPRRPSDTFHIENKKGKIVKR